VIFALQRETQPLVVLGPPALHSLRMIVPPFYFCLDSSLDAPNFNCEVESLNRCTLRVDEPSMKDGSRYLEGLPDALRTKVHVVFMQQHPNLWESSNALEGNYVKKNRALACLTIATTLGFAATAFVSKISADSDNSGHFKFQPDTLVLSRSVYVGTASMITIGETLPLGCPAGPNGSIVVAVPLTRRHHQRYRDLWGRFG
jgi:hypothetical protein